jgi:hypothetical protein
VKPIKFSGKGYGVSDRGQGDRGESASWLEDSLPSKLFYVRFRSRGIADAEKVSAVATDSTAIA